MGGLTKEEAHKVIEEKIDQVVNGLIVQTTTESVGLQGSLEEFITFSTENVEEINQYFIQEDWTDGLPIIPPTVERINKMLNATIRNKNEVIGLMPPFYQPATVEKIAVNCVMAGCLPEYFDLMITVVEAMLEENFNLYGVQATTNPVGPMVIVNGPIRKKLGINGGIGLFGPGWQANATIGRAVRLMLMNIGGARPGIGDMSTLGNPGKFSFCISELEEESPWDPLHIERGFLKNDSTVTIASATAPYNVIHLANDAEIYLEEINDVLLLSGTNFIVFDMQPIIVISPVHAAMLSSQGYTKQKIREKLWEKARMPLRRFDPKTQEAIKAWKSEYIFKEDGQEIIYIIKDPEDIVIVHAGGKGEHSAVMGSFNRSRAITKKVDSSSIRNLKEVADQTIETFRPGFQVDGYEIIVTSVKDNKIYLKLDLKPNACLDCIMPADYLVKMFTGEIQHKTGEEVIIILEDPRVP
ncbi:UGSC family (seleno)protein [Bacillus sp. 1P10SD]|uniref:UGSC family (seleno)protein n=1 Tax=Bacillus sp. 1P10SD TaxID=3132265 RepID=UPI0039A591DB